MINNTYWGRTNNCCKRKSCSKSYWSSSKDNNKQVVKEDSTNAGHSDFPVGFN